jgi:hypothetical protein
VTGDVPRIFVSYRIHDSVYAAGAVADRLAVRFGKARVFRDRDSLSLGSMYPKKIRRALEKSDVVVAVIGPSWLDARDGAGRRRLDEPGDWVRTELRMAFEKEIPVVPVLLDHTPLPLPDRLPAALAPLSRSTCWHVRHETFDSDVRGLIDGIDGIVGGTGGMPPPPPMGTSTQHNHARGRGQVIANQGPGQLRQEFAMTNPQHPVGPVQHNRARGRGQIIANQGSGSQIVNVHSQAARKRTGAAILVVLGIDVVFFFYGFLAYTGQAENTGDLWRAGIMLVLLATTGSLIRRWFRQRI